jgi:hypothetical protein
VHANKRGSWACPAIASRIGAFFWVGVRGSPPPFGTTPGTPRSTGMDPSTDTEIKLRIGYALSDRLAPIACTIVENLRRSTKLIEELPSAAIEAMLDYSKEQHRLDRPRTAAERAYKDVRQSLITYAEVALREAREREERLLYGITGRHEREF